LLVDQEIQQRVVDAVKGGIQLGHGACSGLSPVAVARAEVPHRPVVVLALPFWASVAACRSASHKFGFVVCRRAASEHAPLFVFG
jgi:hypothetical protein